MLDDALAGRLAPLTFLDLDHEVVDREIARDRAERRERAEGRRRTDTRRRTGAVGAPR
ncbi:hypothetical protein [Georgenia sp. SUBG003]|uniref:hypothetical protein n=1 Tax=Georgenia sp. SUBG003 TaxID=1497974 RepID=UPI003AB2710E